MKERELMSTNTLLTAQVIARAALERLRTAMVMPGLVYRDYDKEFKKVGDTVTIRKPAVFVADEFGGTINLQDVGEGSASIKLDILADVSVSIGATELALKIEDFQTQILDGAMLAISEKIASNVCLKAKNGIPYFTGTAGATAATLKAGFTDPMKKLNIAKVPTTQRKLVFDPVAQAELLNLDTVVEADKSGSTQALRDASMGRIMQFETFMDQNVKTHTAGGYTSLADVSVTAGAAKATTITLTSTAGAAITKLLVGDLMTIDGNQYIVTEDTADAVAGVIAAVKIYPGLAKAFGAMTSAAVTFVDRTARAHVANLAFHQNAIALVNAPLEVPAGTSDAYVAIDPVTGLSVRVVFGYDITHKQQIMSVDTLFGAAVIYPELACQVLG